MRECWKDFVTWQFGWFSNIALVFTSDVKDLSFFIFLIWNIKHSKWDWKNAWVRERVWVLSFISLLDVNTFFQFNQNVKMILQNLVCFNLNKCQNENKKLICFNQKLNFKLILQNVFCFNLIKCQIESKDLF